ncbi:MAG: prolyl oligopeptidase family serine peptidase, partial [Myxococcales bacterium]|nr:prolyl oligopeptidase family serine peptidase [Myxococcales bacterium]
TGSSIVYEPMSADKAAESTFIWRHHGFGVLMLFGRFYAGGDVANDIEDMTLGFDLLATRDDVDRTRVGILGGSWGGFEALYGAAYARADLRPSVGAALYPLSDFEAERRFVTEVLPQRYTEETTRAASAEFFEPYLRRVDATVVARGGFEGLRAEDLVARIDAPFLVVHEDWDTLVSLEQSQRLVALAPDRFLPLWVLHDAPPTPWDQNPNTHGPLMAEFAGLGVYPALFAHLLTHLGGPAQPLLLPWDTASFRALLTLMHQRQAEGVDVAFLAPRLAPLCDPRITAYAVDTQASATGAEMVAAELGLAWGVALSADAACEALRAGQLPAP